MSCVELAARADNRAAQKQKATRRSWKEGNIARVEIRGGCGDPEGEPCHRRGDRGRLSLPIPAKDTCRWSEQLEDRSNACPAPLDGGSITAAIRLAGTIPGNLQAIIIRIRSLANPNRTYPGLFVTIPLDPIRFGALAKRWEAPLPV